MKNKFGVALQWVGLACASAGVAQWSIPAGMFVGGVGMIVFGAFAEADQKGGG